MATKKKTSKRGGNVKNKKQYQALKRKGMSKTRAAKIAKLLHKKEFRQALETAPDAAYMYQIIKAESGK